MSNKLRFLIVQSWIHNLLSSTMKSITRLLLLSKTNYRYLINRERTNFSTLTNHCESHKRMLYHTHDNLYADLAASHNRTRNITTDSVVTNVCLHKYLKNLNREFSALMENSVDSTVMQNFDSKNREARLAYLKPLTNVLSQIATVSRDIHDIEHMLLGLREEDKEMFSMGLKEKEECMEKLILLELEAERLLVPVDSNDNNDIILEVTAGVGGQEAMLFAGDLLSMYENYADYSGWSTQLIQYDTHEQGGLRRGSLSMCGRSVYGRMKYEGGVHRVQRVPVTERSGRVHTSTAMVAVLTQPSDIEVDIRPKDLKIETCRSSGKGGQHVNTTDSAVRVVHLPTGMSVECQTARSQIKNKDSALQMLRSRLYQRQLDQQVSQQQSRRKIQVGSGGRSEKIRTYNHQQDRVTDHRITLSLHNLGAYLSGGDLLDTMVDSVAGEARKERLAEILASCTE